LLSGVIAGSFLSAIIMLLIDHAPSSNTRGMAVWLMGDLSTPMPPILGWVLPTGFFIGFAMIYLTASEPEFIASRRKRGECISRRRAKSTDCRLPDGVRAY